MANDDTQQKNIQRNGKFLAYMSDFYYAIGILIFVIAAWFMFNEPIGASMLSFDMSIVLVAFAILYAAASLTRDQVLKFLSKYLVLIGFMITAYQFMADYNFLSLLQIVFFVSIIIFAVNFIFDFIIYFKETVQMIWDWIAKRR